MTFNTVVIPASHVLLDGSRVQNPLRSLQTDDFPSRSRIRGLFTLSTLPTSRTYHNVETQELIGGTHDILEINR